MSINEIKKEIQTLSGDERHELSAFLVELDLADDSGYWERVRRRSDDKDPNHWVSVEQLSKS